jgi:hypothetical protein
MEAPTQRERPAEPRGSGYLATVSHAFLSYRRDDDPRVSHVDFARDVGRLLEDLR